jgi:F-type H+-transporting ATPase subunit delta
MSDLTTAARPYARAAFELARDTGTFAEWSDRLQLLSAVVLDSQMNAILDAPSMGAGQRAELILKVCGDKVGEPGANLVRLMAENGRLKLMAEVTALYEVLRAQAEGKVEAQVTAAQPLTDEQQAAIAASLSKRLGSEVSLSVEIDEELLGGAIIRANDLVIDGSVRGRLNKLASKLAH